MKQLSLFVLLFALLLSGCSPDKSNQEVTLSPDERTDLYETAISAARDEQSNEAFPLITESDDDMAALVFEILGVKPENMACYALSVSPMNVKAYAVGAIYPAAGKKDLLLENLRTFMVEQQQSFKNYLADQYEIAVNTRLETLEDGTILLVMTENQDALFDAIRDTIERGT